MSKLSENHHHAIYATVSLNNSTSDMATGADKFHTILLCALDTAAVLANMVLVYAILTRTPPRMRSYSILLLSNAFIDIVSALASMLCIARLIFYREVPAEVYVFVGPCTHVGGWFCHLCQSNHSALILLHSFSFRLYIINENNHRAAVKAKATLLICILSYCPTILMMHFYYSSREPATPELLAALHLQHYVVTWHPDICDYRFIISVGWIMTLSPAAMVMLFFLRRNLIRGIKKMETGAKDHHSKVAKALSFQLLLPAGQALAGSTWLAIVFRIWEDEAAERFIMIVTSFFALGSPLINLYFLPPYRRMFSRGAKAKVIRVTTSSEARNNENCV